MQMKFEFVFFFTLCASLKFKFSRRRFFHWIFFSSLNFIKMLSFPLFISLIKTEQHNR